METIPVIIHAGFEGKMDKDSIRERMRNNPEGVVFEVLHNGEQITGHNALNREWTLEVCVQSDQATVTETVAFIDFDVDRDHPLQILQAVVR